MDTEDSSAIQILRHRIETIEARNARVEIDKQWETSLTRTLAVTILTYLVMVALLAGLGNQSPFAHATVPTVGFVLSNCSLTVLKSVWSKQQIKRLDRNSSNLPQ